MQKFNSGLGCKRKNEIKSIWNSTESEYLQDFVSYITGIMLWNHAIPKLELDNFQCANLWVAFSPYLGPTFDPNSSWWNQGKFRRKKLGVAFVAWNPDGGINLELSPAAAFFAFSLPSFGPFAFFFQTCFFSFSQTAGWGGVFSASLFWDQIKW